MKITIDHITTDVAPGTTVLKAAEILGIHIPSMCFGDGKSNHPSCMVCMVKDLSSGKMFPSCAMPVQEGMQVQTHSPEIRELRREALELLLGDHVGDCEAPCRLSCPAFMNIPLMNRLIAGGHIQSALDIVREEIAIPLILGYICPAPCEKACHRKSVDEAVSICMLKRFTAQDPAYRTQNLLNGMTENGRNVAVVGSGPAGLSAAFYLRRMGYTVNIYDRQPLPGGTLRYSIPEEKLPREALDAEIDCLKLMGVSIFTNQEISAKRFEEEIISQNDAVILATGNLDENTAMIFSLLPDEHGNLINRKTCATSRPGVFGCGSIMKDQQMAVRSAAQGKLAAIEADLFITSGKPKRLRFHFHSAISHLQPDEVEVYLQESDPGTRLQPKDGWLSGFSAAEAVLEAKRCMHCDCRKPVTCKLRILSDEYQANRKRFSGPDRKRLTKLIRHDLIVYEPEKCIKCGICVEITARYKEELGLTFIGRGFDVRVGVPLGNELKDGITKSAYFCVEGCPTGALALKDQEEGVESGKRFRMTGSGWKNVTTFFTITALYFLLSLLPVYAQMSGNTCWPGFRGDPQLTGNSPAKISPPLRLIWTFKTGDAIKSSAVVCNDKIYIGSNDGFLYALTSAGQLAWKFNAGNSIESPPLIAGTAVIFGTLEGNIFSLDAATGKENWKYSTDGQVSGAPNILKQPDNKGFDILAGSYDYNLHCMDGATGKSRWKYETANFINGTPALFGKIAIFGGCDGNLYLVNAANGQLIEKVDIETYMASSPAVGGSKVYFGNYDGEFFCFDLRKKKMVWKTEGGGPFLSSPAIAGNRVVIGSQNKTLYCYDASSGTVLWKYKALGKIDASPVISGNLVVIASADGRLRLIDLASGKEIWSYEIGSPVYSTPAVTSMGVVVGAEDGSVYLFGK